MRVCLVFRSHNFDALFANACVIFQSHALFDASLVMFKTKYVISLSSKSFSLSHLPHLLLHHHDGLHCLLSDKTIVSHLKKDISEVSQSKMMISYRLLTLFVLPIFFLLTL